MGWLSFTWCVYCSYGSVEYGQLGSLSIGVHVKAVHLDIGLEEGAGPSEYQIRNSARQPISSRSCIS